MMDLKKQTFFNTIGNTVYLLSLWFLTVTTTQFLGYEAVGNLTLAMTIGNIVILFQLYGVRGFQSSDMNFYYTPNVYLKARVLTVAGGILLGAILCHWLDYPPTLFLTIFLFIIIKSSEAFSDVLYGDDQRAGKLELAGYSMFFRGILTGFLFFIGVFFLRNLNLSLFLISLASISLTVFCDFHFYQRTITNHEKSSLDQAMGVLRQCFPLLITTLVPAIIIAIPRIVLVYWYGTELLGYYGNISAPALFLNTVIPNILLTLLPQYGKLFIKGDYYGIVKIWRRSILGTVLLGLLCLLGAFFLGHPVLAYVYTKEILPYVHFLYYVLIAMDIYAIEICCATVLVAMRKNFILTNAALLSLVICLVVSFPLIKKYGIGGAVAVLVISYLIQVIIQSFFIVRTCIWKK